ncbi:MAG: RNA 2',3'-cyclic phosphodiesterase [Anaerolineae bacterium]
MSDTTMRLFIAAPLTAEARRDLQAHLDICVPGGRLPGRVVPPANWHFTLRFLGDVAPAEYEALRASLARLRLGDAFDLAMSGLGAFPRPDRARVLWIGTSTGARELSELARLVESAVVELGFEQDRRPFRPHLTLSRLRPDGDVQAVVDAVPDARVQMRVDEIQIVRSHLGPSGARYETLDHLPLTSP